MKCNKYPFITSIFVWIGNEQLSTAVTLSHTHTSVMVFGIYAIVVAIFCFKFRSGTHSHIHISGVGICFDKLNSMLACSSAIHMKFNRANFKIILIQLLFYFINVNNNVYLCFCVMCDRGILWITSMQLNSVLCIFTFVIFRNFWKMPLAEAPFIF